MPELCLLELRTRYAEFFDNKNNAEGKENIFQETKSLFPKTSLFKMDINFSTTTNLPSTTEVIIFFFFK